VLIFLAMEYTKKQKLQGEGFMDDLDSSDMMLDTNEENIDIMGYEPSTPSKTVYASQPTNKTVQTKPKQADNTMKLPKDCFPKDKLTAEDLLPRDSANSKWAQVNPAGQGDVKDQNFLNAAYHVGINTVGTSLRNPNMQLRSEPPNPQMKVSPWNQTTIESDLNRRPLEIGGCE
jgi:hypothetical protein